MDFDNHVLGFSQAPDDGPVPLSPLFHILFSVNQCDSAPCENGGTCFVVATGYRCFCPTGYEGTNCQIPGEFYSEFIGQACTCRRLLIIDSIYARLICNSWCTSICRIHLV